MYAGNVCGHDSDLLPELLGDFGGQAIEIGLREPGLGGV